MAQGFVIVKSSRSYGGGPGRYGVQRTLAEAKALAVKDGNPVGFDIYKYRSKSRKYIDEAPVVRVRIKENGEGTFHGLLSGSADGDWREQFYYFTDAAQDIQTFTTLSAAKTAAKHEGRREAIDITIFHAGKKVAQVDLP